MAYTRGKHKVLTLLDRCVANFYDIFMIRHFGRPELLEAEEGGRFQWEAALGAGLIPGLVLMLVPRGSPWAGLAVFAPVLMGRSLPAGLSPVSYTHLTLPT